MASLPARQSSRPRRASPSEQSQASTTQPQESLAQVRSQSEDSQTIFVNKPAEEEAEVEQEKSLPAETPAGQDEDEVMRCWICMSDSTEDGPDTSPWRDPCPCALVAHEECLLDWIADMESPKNAHNRSRSGKIECPQCKAEIKLSRPRDYIVDAMRGLERMTDRAVIPVSGLALSSAMVHISQYVGVHTIYAIFGADDGNRLLEPLWRWATQPPVEVYASEPEKVWEILSTLFLDRLKHWRLIVGLPLITPVLVLSRTSLADSVLPVLPIVFFASQAHSPSDALDFASWPPSASFAFAVLPYVRSLYNAYYKRVWAEKEKQWLEAVKPRVSQQNEEDAAANNGQNPVEAEGDGNVFEVRIEQEVWEDDWEQEDQRLVQQAADRQPAAHNEAQQPGLQTEQNNDEDANAPEQAAGEVPQQAQAPQRDLPQEGGFPRGDNGAAPAPVVPRDRLEDFARRRQEAQGQHNNAGNVQNVERRLSLSLTGMAETFLGALFFPTIAGLTGEALKLVLPHRWVTPPPMRVFRETWAAGFLQSKWARSLVGGCLFVVCKDFLRLYVCWRAAQLHKDRRVLDVDRRKGRGSFRP
ncbi:hypothetical protein CKM354_000121200 [Cercospora kikuchii]|uniref:RING-CH-type domain-containing protein n=1 Tax=Cercospora kikuchii TaxID=84275 RepID=A0A9P3CAB1_9PEZI|nr:uncharacterized protein CKM354_000121200 [Cercospora kikuchii]GIZ37776.1 hypothetical protein CKM354_000121200 [Cercospora kikuchii]